MPRPRYNIDRIAGPSMIFDPATYDRLGIPAVMQVGSDLERALYNAPPSSSPDTAGFRLDRITGGFAKLTTLDPDGTHREAIFARLDSSGTLLRCIVAGVGLY